MLKRKEKMKLHSMHVYGCVFSLFLIVSASGVLASNEDKKPANPIGGGSGWNAEVKKTEPQPGPANMDEDTRKLVQSISDYFNGIPQLQGEFKQTNPDNKVATGRFYLKRPGKLRFDYSPPSRMRIVSDGKWLSIEDHDLKNSDQYPLESTPFRLLMTETVDLLTHAKIIDVSKGENVAIITVSDKEEEGSGQLKLFFTLPELKLQQWIITDPQGLDTRIELAETIVDQQKEDKFFDVAKFELKQQ